MESTVAIEQKVDSKTFAIPILTASALIYNLAVRIGIANALESTFYSIAIVDSILIVCIVF